jgi:pimeloyl-ACP methyl ester carboxylesterase
MSPAWVRFLDRLSSFSRHVWFDPRGRGASDPLPHQEERFAEAIADGMLALVDHLGWEQVAVVGDMPPQILFAASHPERTKALVLINTGARLAPPEMFPPGGLSERVERMRRQWGTGAAVEQTAPSVAGDARFRDWLGRSQRLLCTADEMARRGVAARAMDMRPALPSVQAPTLLVHRQRLLTAAPYRADAQQIPGAKVVELPGEDFLLTEAVAGSVLSFRFHHLLPLAVEVQHFR